MAGKETNKTSGSFFCVEAWFCFGGKHVRNTAASAIIIPAIFTQVEDSLYKYSEKTNGITSDNLLATEATATPIFCVVKAIRLNNKIKSDPISKAHLNQGSPVEAALIGKLPLTMEPVITQVI